MNEIDENWLGVMIDFEDPFGIKGSAPGWQCKTCGWTIGSQGAPPHHDCPQDGIQQKCDHEFGEPTDTGLFNHFYKCHIMCHECVKCGKKSYRFEERE